MCRCKSRSKPIILLFSLLLFMLLPTRALAAEVVVNNVPELQDAVVNATEGDVIKFSHVFVPGNVTLNMPSANVTIDGENFVWDTGTFKITGAGGKKLTIKNLKIDGTRATERLLKNNATNGTLVLERMDFYNSKKGAIEINTPKTSTTIISYTKIYNNTANDTASAIWLAGYSPVFIKNSTIEDNVGTGAGYECGAISSKNFEGLLEINNTVFRNNRNECTKSGPVGGGGGAIAFHYFYGTLTINNSLFERNRTAMEGNDKSTFDGGAIYIFDGGGNKGATININSTTFDSNLACDDGGAMLIQGTGKPGLATTITNCTFYNNIAYGVHGGNLTGGAIQYFKNGRETDLTNVIINSTFVNNRSGNENSTVNQTGGAIGLSGSSYNRAPLEYYGNLFIGNKVYNNNGQLNEASNYKDVSNTAAINTNRNLINADKGSTPTYTVDDVLGKNFRLCENLSGVKAGVDDEIVKTIPLKPEGIADNAYNNIDMLPTTDQRSFKIYKDQGSIEMSWVKYDANGGSFGLTPQTEYVGQVYYEADATNKANSYYTVGTIDGVTSVVDGINTLNATYDGKRFLGWASTADATVADPAYQTGESLTYREDNLTLYAVWETGVKVTYHSNFIPDETFEQSYDGGNVTTATYPATGLPNRPNYIFLKWTTSEDGTGTSYLPEETFTISDHTHLYAQWQSTNALKLQWSVSKTTNAINEYTDVENNSTTSVMENTPVYVQIRPVNLEHVDYDAWSIEYTATPNYYHYPMNAPIGKTVRYSFNMGEAHVLEGDYYYTVTKLVLYKNNTEVDTYVYNSTGCTHRVIIEAVPVEKVPVLQWMVSTISHEDHHFSDVDDQSVTSVKCGTPVFLQIRPEGHDEIDFERWSVEYTVTPDECYGDVSPCGKNERHSFYNRQAHTEEGTYEYIVTRLILHDLNGTRALKTYDYSDSPYRHTIVISDEIGPGPGPEPQPGLGSIGEIAPYCDVEREFRIPVEQFDPTDVLEYSVRFSAEAKEAGFSDTPYQTLTANYASVSVGSRIPAGIYYGDIYLRLKNAPDQEVFYPFSLVTLERTTIIRQPESVDVCDGDAFTLTVEAEGLNLGYQWFFNDEAILGATSDTYQAALTADREGQYYVEVYGNCGMDSSRVVTVAKKGLKIQVKWNEFLYITNPDNEYVRFQWYKDGTAIDKNSTSIYYSIPEGLLGTYFVRAYRADDTYVESCSITFETLTQFPITRVYPSMVTKSSPITIDLGNTSLETESALIEIYNMNGQVLDRKKTNNCETNIPADMASGTYIIKVTTDSGRISTHKIIVK